MADADFNDGIAQALKVLRERLSTQKFKAAQALASMKNHEEAAQQLQESIWTIEGKSRPVEKQEASQ